jgi:hypothetical protein
VDDNDDNKSLATSESGSVHLIVDETAMIIEPSTNQVEVESSLQSKPATFDSLETRDSMKNTIETLEQEKSNDSNPSLVNVSDENSQKPDKISQDEDMESKAESKEEENQTDEFVGKENVVEEMSWVLEGEPKKTEDSNGIKYGSIKNVKDGCLICENDFILFENKNPKAKDAYVSETDCSKADNVYNELMDESSNTNYSIDENEKAEPDCVYIAKVESFWKDGNSDKLMMSIRNLYKPEQLKGEIESLMKESEINFCKNELVFTSQIDVMECNSIRSKCVVYDNENYEK